MTTTVKLTRSNAKKQPAQPASTYAALLRLHGLRATLQRVQVLHLLATSPRPVSISDLQKKLEKSADALDTVTLYRSLETLVEKSLVRPVDLRHGHTDYELVQEGKHHHHLICGTCGLVEDFAWCPEAKLEKEILASTSQFAKLSDHSLEFFGTCRTCENTAKVKSRSVVTIKNSK